MLNLYVRALLSKSLSESGEIRIGSVHSHEVITEEMKLLRAGSRYSDPEFQKALMEFRKIRKSRLYRTMTEGK